MKHSRLKKAQKILNNYCNYFKYYSPYQILVDATFCLAALQNKIAISDQLEKYFQTQIKLITTQCIILESESLGPKLSGATSIVKNCLVHKCGHEGKPVTGEHCIKTMVKTSKYFVATQDRGVQNYLRKLPGQGLIYLHKNAPILEALSEASKRFIQKTNHKLVDLKDCETQILSKIKPKSEGSKPRNFLPKRIDKKRAKNPNPLSCKKKKKRVIKKPES